MKSEISPVSPDNDKQAYQNNFLGFAKAFVQFFDRDQSNGLNADEFANGMQSVFDWTLTSIFKKVPTLVQGPAKAFAERVKPKISIQDFKSLFHAMIQDSGQSELKSTDIARLFIFQDKPREKTKEDPSGHFERDGIITNKEASYFTELIQSQTQKLAERISSLKNEFPLTAK